MASLRTSLSSTFFRCSVVLRPYRLPSLISPLISNLAPPAFVEGHVFFARDYWPFGSISQPFLRSFASSPDSNAYSAELDEINAKFAEAREEIEMAMESKDTIYFDEEAETARVAAKIVLEKYDTLLKKLPEADMGAVHRSMGLKMEQLKAELEQLKD